MEWSELIAEVSAFLCCPVLFLIALDRACFGRDRWSRMLRWGLVLLALAALVLLGGEDVLKQQGLAWRNNPEALLTGLFLLIGTFCILFTAGATSQVLRRFRTAVRLPTQMALWIAALLTAGLLLFWSAMGIGFGCSGEERVVEYQGETLLEVRDSILGLRYEYYRYAGPLVRGKVQVHWSETPIDYAEKEGQTP